MTDHDDWLAAWDAADEAERRLVLAELERHRSGSFVIAARRDGATLIVGACLYAAEYKWAQSGSDYELIYVDIVDVIVTRGGVTSWTLDRREELQTLSYEQTSSGNEEPFARQVAAELLSIYPALSHVGARLSAESSREIARGMTSEARPVSVQVIAREMRGTRLVVRTCGWYRLYFQAQSGSDWSTQYIAIDELGVEGGRVWGERTIGTVEAGLTEGQADDHAEATRIEETNLSEAIARFRTAI